MSDYPAVWLYTPVGDVLFYALIKALNAMRLLFIEELPWYLTHILNIEVYL